MMIHPDFHTAMARERTAMLTASAAARRQARELGRLGSRGGPPRLRPCPARSCCATGRRC